MSLTVNLNGTNRLRAELSGGFSGAVLYTKAQDLTDAEKAQARENIDAVSSAELSALSDSTDTKLSDLSAELTGKIDNLSADTDTKLSALSTSVDGQISALSTEVNGKIADLSADTESKISDLSADTDEKITALSDSTDERIANLSADTSEKIAFLQAENDALKLENKLQSIDIANLKAAAEGKLYAEQLDTDTAYTRSVPSSALPYAELKSIGGNTVKCTNLWDEQWELGAIGSNGENVASASRIRSKNYTEIKPNVDYYFYWATSNYLVGYWYDESYTFISSFENLSNRVRTSPTNAKYVRFYLFTSNGQYDESNRAAIIEGTSGAYEPYFEGLHSAEVQSIESRGINLLDMDGWLKSSGATYTKNGNEYTINRLSDLRQSHDSGAYRFSNKDISVRFTFGKMTGITATNLRFDIVSESGSFVSIFPDQGGTVATGVLIRSNYSSDGSALLSDFQLTTNLVVDAYSPYFSSSLPIPSAIRELDGYGWGIGDIYNEVNFEPVTYHNMKSVDLGGLSWSWYSEYSCWLTEAITDFVMPATSSVPFNGISDTYNVTDASATNRALPNSLFASSTRKRIFVNNGSTTEKPTGILHYEATEGGEDYEAKLFTKRVGRVDLSSLEWQYYASGKFFYVSNAQQYVKGSPLTAEYSFIGAIPDRLHNIDKALSVNEARSSLRISDYAYTDVTAFRLAVSGKSLYYELTTPQVLDITDLLPEDFGFIEVEGGGTVTMENENKLDVPSKINYLIKL